MKALSLTAPWGILAMLNLKGCETRSWYTSYRGPLAIHSAKRFPPVAQRLCLRPPFYQALTGAGYHVGLSVVNDKFRHDLPLGAVLATTHLLDCVPVEDFARRYPRRDTARERAFGDFSEGRYIWILDTATRLAVPVPARGALGLWEWDEAA